jgi:hypothetical protein
LALIGGWPWNARTCAVAAAVKYFSSILNIWNAPLCGLLILLFKLWSFHGYLMQWSLLGLIAVWDWRVPTFQRLYSASIIRVVVPLITSILMKEAETVSETLDFNASLTRMIAWEDLSAILLLLPVRPRKIQMFLKRNFCSSCF